MREFRVNSKDIASIEEWCVQYIGPRKYYLPKQFGGHGWSIKRMYSTIPTVAIEDDKVALMAMIKFGA